MKSKNTKTTGKEKLEVHKPSKSEAVGRARGTDARPAYFLAYVCVKCPKPCYFIVTSDEKGWASILSQTCPILPKEANWQRLARKTDNAVAILKKRYSRKRKE
jgi:hypothetical protein